MTGTTRRLAHCFQPEGAIPQAPGQDGRPARHRATRRLGPAWEQRRSYELMLQSSAFQVTPTFEVFGSTPLRAFDQA